MSIWLIRAGSHGQYEQKFIQEKRVYVTWERLDVDVSKLADSPALLAEMQKRYPDAKLNKLRNWVRQVWPFAHVIKKGDLVILPSKQQSQETPVGRPEVDQLIGAMDNTKADAALFVAWGGFKPTVYRELANRFFRVRLWTQKELLEQLFATYDKLDEDLRAELPLKRVWTVAAQDEE